MAFEMFWNDEMVLGLLKTKSNSKLVQKSRE